jgi:DNA-binding NtrC family response regulator
MRKKVIVVDDDKDVLNLIKTVLEMLKFDVFSFLSPMNALEAIEEIDTKVALLVTDFDMPDMDGGELARRVKNKIPGIKVACISGFPGNEDYCKSCDVFRNKPITVTKIKSVVEELFPPK